MTISINDVPLTNPLYGWTLLKESSRSSDIAFARTDLVLGNTHGSVPARGFFSKPAKTIVIGMRESGLNYLHALLSSMRLVYKKDALSAVVEVQNISHRTVGMGDDPETEVSIVLSIPGVWGRGAINEFNISSGGQTTTNILQGLSGFVNDAVFIITGSGVSNVKLTNMGTGSAWQLNQTLNGSVRFEALTGHTYASSEWSGGQKLRPDLTTLPPYIGNAFELSPIFESGQTFARLRTSGSKGFTVQVRARTAVLI